MDNGVISGGIVSLREGQIGTESMSIARSSPLLI